jgi:hypothetical protein
MVAEIDGWLAGVLPQNSTNVSTPHPSFFLQLDYD